MDMAIKNQDLLLTAPKDSEDFLCSQGLLLIPANGNMN
jgi:hypothetical protein